MSGQEPPPVNHISDPETWVDKYGDYLYSYALTRIHNPAQAEDLTQETFVAALNSRDTFLGRSSERTWLTGILKHKIIDLIRKQSRERLVGDIDTVTMSIDGQFDEKDHWNAAPAKWSVNPEDLVDRKEFWEAFAGCLSDLSSKLSGAFILREIDGMSAREICKVLDISATNYWVILYRARMFLRHCLEKNWFGGKTK